MILLDTNIAMYAAGAAHRNKDSSASLLRRVARGELEAAIDAEALQEILHRYRAIRRWDDGRRVYDLVRKIVPTVLPIAATVTDRARRLMDVHTSLAARDALHAAVVDEYELEGLCSFDRDFDVIPGLRRVEPSDLLTR